MTSDDESEWIIINPNNKKNVVFRQPVNIVPTITTSCEIQPFVDEAKPYYSEANHTIQGYETANIVQEVDTDKSSGETHIINTRDDIMADLILGSTVPFKKSIVSRYKKDVYALNAFDPFRNIPVVLFNNGQQLYKSAPPRNIMEQSVTSFIMKRGLKVSFIILKWYFYHNWKFNALLVGINTLLYIRKISLYFK